MYGPYYGPYYGMGWVSLGGVRYKAPYSVQQPDVVSFIIYTSNYLKFSWSEIICIIWFCKICVCSEIWDWSLCRLNYCSRFFITTFGGFIAPFQPRQGFSDFLIIQIFNMHSNSKLKTSRYQIIENLKMGSQYCFFFHNKKNS